MGVGPPLSNTLPVDLEAIAEFDLGLDIFPFSKPQ
jgi:hypothetical protein